MLTRLFLIRHGEVDERWRGRIYGALDVPLSARGADESRLLVERLRDVAFAAVVSSGLARTEFAAAALRAPRGLARLDDSELRELERGAWAGLTPAELEGREPGAWERWLRAPASTHPPGGESLVDLAGRALPALQRWAGLHAGQNVALVTHSWVARLAACSALGLELEVATRLDVPTASLVIVDWPVAGAMGESLLRPTLVGFALDAPPPAGTRWFRGPHRDAASQAAG